MSLVETQRQFAAHIRHPENNAPVAGIEARRLKIYTELFYNNIEGFLHKTFPVLRSLFPDDRWHEMARDFVCRHQSETPLFHEISQEFLTYLQDERDDPDDVPFLYELAHYEWVELALDIHVAHHKDSVALPVNPMSATLALSELAWPLVYAWPVHRIQPDFQPELPPEQPTFLIVHRDRHDRVNFIEINAPTYRLLQLLGDEGMPLAEAVAILAKELQHQDVDVLGRFAVDLLVPLVENDVLLVM